MSKVPKSGHEMGNANPHDESYRYSAENKVLPEVCNLQMSLKGKKIF
jgi:hypothetical protein